MCVRCVGNKVPYAAELGFVVCCPSVFEQNFGQISIPNIKCKGKV